MFAVLSGAGLAHADIYYVSVAGLGGEPDYEQHFAAQAADLDRITRGAVVDFISLHWHSVYTFPAFNLADSAITLGAICIVLDELRRVRKG